MTDSYHKLKLVPLLFGTFNRSTATAAEAELSQSLQTAFANFAKDPLNASPVLNWPTYEPGFLGIADIPTLAEIAYAGNVGFGDFVKLVQPISKVSMRKLYPKLSSHLRTSGSSKRMGHASYGMRFWISAPEKPSNAAESWIQVCTVGVKGPPCIRTILEFYKHVQCIPFLRFNRLRSWKPHLKRHTLILLHTVVLMSKRVVGQHCPEVRHNDDDEYQYKEPKTPSSLITAKTAVGILVANHHLRRGRRKNTTALC